MAGIPPLDSDAPGGDFYPSLPTTPTDDITWLYGDAPEEGDMDVAAVGVPGAWAAGPSDGAPSTGSPALYVVGGAESACTAGGESHESVGLPGVMATAVVGADTWPIEVVPNPDTNLAFPVHQELLARRGIFIHENLATERLAERGVYEFAYIFSPVPIKGATGSPGAPLAVH